MKLRILKVHPEDDMVVALDDLKKGDEVLLQGTKCVLKDNIPAKHKFSTRHFSQGETLKMYGVVVGKALEDIPAGAAITVKNLKHQASEYSLSDFQYFWPQPDISRFKDKTFMGYVREDGRAGTANFWVFIPTVFCENRNLDVIREALQSELGYSISEKYKIKTEKLVELYKKGWTAEQIAGANLSAADNASKNRLFPNIDGIKFLTHQGGCGGTRQDSETLSNLLAAYADHPNVAGVTVLSLGCQHLQIEDLKASILKRNPEFKKPLLTFEQQQTGTEEELVTEALKHTFIALTKANDVKRTPVPLSKLVLGVKCGGSDGFSGISANPALGHAADILVALGGSVLLAEFPELNGVEQDLVNRCISLESAQKFIKLMKEYSDQAKAVGSGFDMNPSPGNIKDGLITDAIKSAGAAKKGGTSPVVDVLDYTEKTTKPGLNLVCTPGNDVEATTGKAAAGANIIVFTTGLGTPTGNPICPVIKVSTNTKLKEKMSDIIDFDTGDIIKGEKTVEQMGEELLDFCIKVASGEIIPKAVELGQDDFIPWKRGVSL